MLFHMHDYLLLCSLISVNSADMQNYIYLILKWDFRTNELFQQTLTRSIRNMRAIKNTDIGEIWMAMEGDILGPL